MDPSLYIPALLAFSPELYNNVVRTLRDHSFEADNVGMVKLRHDGRLGQEVPLLLLRVSSLESLQGHGRVSFSREPHPSVTDLSELP